jgi:hypothetical protein
VAPLFVAITPGMKIDFPGGDAWEHEANRVTAGDGTPSQISEYRE